MKPFQKATLPFDLSDSLQTFIYEDSQPCFLQVSTFSYLGMRWIGKRWGHGPRWCLVWEEKVLVRSEQGRRGVP